MSYSFRSCPVLQGSFLRHAAYLRHRLHLLSFHLHSGWISALQLQAVHARLRPPSQLLLFPSAPLQKPEPLPPKNAWYFAKTVLVDVLCMAAANGIAPLLFGFLMG